MAKRKTTQTGRAAIEAYFDELDNAVHTAENPTGRGLAEVQVEIEQKIRENSGDATDEHLKLFGEYARRVHDHRISPEKAREEIGVLLDKSYGTEAPAPAE